MKCNECVVDYRLNSGQCSQCPKNCEHCEVNNSSISCLRCQQNFALYGEEFKECVACPSYCETCRALSEYNVICSTCQKGFSLVDGICKGKITFTEQSMKIVFLIASFQRATNQVSKIANFAHQKLILLAELLALHATKDTHYQMTSGIVTLVITQA